MVHQVFAVLIAGLLIGCTTIIVALRQSHALLDALVTRDDAIYLLPSAQPMQDAPTMLHQDQHHLQASTVGFEANNVTTAMLLIAIDRRNGCPENCILMTTRLPPWVVFRYIDFGTHQDLEWRDDRTSHLLIIARTNIIHLADFSARRRERFPHLSTCLMHMADERIFAGEITKPYRHFDYVLRNYCLTKLPETTWLSRCCSTFGLTSARAGSSTAAGSRA